MKPNDPLTNESRSNYPADMVPRNPLSLTRLTTIAIVGNIALLVSAWLLPAVSEYTLLRDNISETVLGRFGTVLTIAFLVAGVGTIAPAFSLRELMAAS